MVRYMISTVDNPHNPFTDWDAWYAYDEQQGYHTTTYLARVANTSSELSDALQESIYEQAVDEIVKMNINGKYRKVMSPDDVAAALGTTDVVST